jgi:hypothetical protein
MGAAGNSRGVVGMVVVDGMANRGEVPRQESVRRFRNLPDYIQARPQAGEENRPEASSTRLQPRTIHAARLFKPICLAKRNKASRLQRVAKIAD